MNKEKVILISVNTNNQIDENEYSIDELKNLAETVNAEIQMVITQNRNNIDSSWYIGKGKLEEITNLVEELKTDILIFNCELSPSQVRNIENKVKCKVIDRTQLILDIFASRANSKEGKIQVELAQLSYMLPRLTGKGISLSRLAGGIGTRGPGETKLETDRRHIKRRITYLKAKLTEINIQRKLYRKRREKNNIYRIALVGYTNAGKSTILNQLTDSNVLSEDKLFATLDPTSKKLKIKNKKDIILTDTVGFIQDLPHDLIAAFKSTFQEVAEADLLLHIVDSSHPNRENHINIVEKLLHEIDAINIPRITIYNKKDLISDFIIDNVDDHIFISAYDKNDKQRLLDLIACKISENWVKYNFRIPSDRGDLLSYIRNNSELINEIKWDEVDQYWQIDVLLDKDYLNKEILRYQN